MTDTTTPLLGLLLMGTGGDNNAWGANLNAQVIALIEQAIAGVTSMAPTAGTVTLTADQSRSAVIELTGTLTANVMLVLPATAKTWKFLNKSVLGGFEVQVNAGGTARNLPGGWTEIISDGSGALDRSDGHKVGEFFYHAAATAPNHALECNGATASRTVYADLYAKIGTTWGVGDGVTTFMLPNAEDTGRYIRSKDGSFAVGTYQSNQNAAHTHSMTGAMTAGTLGTDSQGAHIHGVFPGTETHTHSYNQTSLPGGSLIANGSGLTVSTTGATTGTNSVNPSIRDTAGGGGTANQTASAGAHTHNITGIPGIGTLSAASSGAGEARPESLVGLLCIRY